MKRILLTLICGVTAFFCSCKDDGSENPDFRLYQAEVADVTATAASVTCRAAFDLEEYAGVGKGFVYGPAAQEIDSYAVAASPVVKGNTLSGRLTGLTPATEYRVCAFIDLGASRVYGEAAAFRTTRVAGDEPVLEITGATTMTASAEGGSFTITYKVYNAAGGATVGASSNQEWVRSFDVSTPERVAFTVEVNPGAERQAIVTLTYPGAESCAVTLVQAAAGAVPPPAEPTFGTPSHTSVTQSQASVSCTFSYDGEEPVTAVYFAYKPASGAEQRVSVTTTAGNKSTALTGLAASTTYTYRLAVEIGDRSYSSATASFTTASGGGQTGKTKYSGWAELVPEDESNSDYHYAYHLCPDLNIDGYKARNYTVCFSAEHHCPVWVAAPRHACYEGSANRTNAYKKDPDIPSNIQYNSKDTGGGCNKGHMLGSAERTRSTEINRQVFYYSNIAPQYSSGFNTGGGGWNTLEDWIDKQVCADTTYLVIGTYFEPYTDKYGNSASPKKISFGGRNDVSCPTMFYIAVLRTKKGNSRKWVVDCSADELKSAVFVRCHNNALKGVKVSSKDMISVAELEKLTGHTFFSNVPNAPKESYTPSDWGL